VGNPPGQRAILKVKRLKEKLRIVWSKSSRVDPAGPAFFNEKQCLPRCVFWHLLAFLLQSISKFFLKCIAGKIDYRFEPTSDIFFLLKYEDTVRRDPKYMIYPI
jgi:hypothetical protein